MATYSANNLISGGSFSLGGAPLAFLSGGQPCRAADRATAPYARQGQENRPCETWQASARQGQAVRASASWRTFGPPVEDVTDATGDIDPAQGAAVARRVAVALSITPGSSGLPRILVIVDYPEASKANGASQLVYDGDDFVGRFAATSSRAVDSDGVVTFTILPAAGWPSTPTLRAFDVQASELGTLAEFVGIGRPAASGASPATAHAPAEGSDVGRNDVVRVDITSPAGVPTVVVFARYANQVPEVVYDGLNFCPLYDNGECRRDDGTPSTSKFSTLRSGGWPDSSFTVEAVAVRGEITLTPPPEIILH